jgi:DNA helicase TIP49 (TBP-interacting protein)
MDKQESINEYFKRVIGVSLVEEDQTSESTVVSENKRDRLTKESKNLDNFI